MPSYNIRIFLMSSLLTFLARSVANGAIYVWDNINKNVHTVIQAEYLPNHIDNYTLTANLRKEFGRYNTSVELTGSYTINQSKILRQSVISDYRFDSYSIISHFAIDIIKGIRFTEDFSWRYSVRNQRTIIIKYITLIMMPHSTSVLFPTA